MLLAYVAYPVSNGHMICLSLVPNKRDQHSGPLRVDLLFKSEAAIFWVGGDEAITVIEVPEKRARIISPVAPSRLFLTPDSSNYPGIFAHKIMIVDHGQGNYETLHKPQHNSEWQPWRPSDFEK